MPKVTPKASVLLSGGNPQIAKGKGNAPVQAYLDAIPAGWKQDSARRLDALIVQTIPHVRKAVKWNSPFYGIAGQGWFLSFHLFARYIKITFFRGKSLTPVPPEPSKDPDAAYFHIYENQQVNEKLLASWVKQAAALPGWIANAKEDGPMAQPLADWREQMLADVRRLIIEADPGVVETVKWRKPSNNMTGVPVWEHNGILCTGETYKHYVKLTFAQGASLPDPAGLFNASLTGGTRRAIDLREGDKLNARAFKALIKAAVKLNRAK